VGRLMKLWLMGAAALCGAGSWFLTKWVSQWAVHHLMDFPNERSSHVRPTPRGGGVAIVVVVLACVLLYGLETDALSSVGPYVAGAVLISAVSFLDDMSRLPWTARLFVHAVGAAIAIGAYTHWRGMELGASPVLGVAVAFIWIVGLTNAYNFMDGIDGIAAGQAVVAGLAWVVLGLMLRTPAASLIGISVAAASVGFLRYNWPPARIFMGDVGSAFLGYTFAVLPFMAKPDMPTMSAGLLVVGTFVFDALYTFVRRLWRGENVFQAHRSHLYQRLTAAGRSHRQVTVMYAGLAALLGCGAPLVLLSPRRALAILLLAAFALGVALLSTTKRQETVNPLRKPVRTP
jgi:UDP-N-acetylmuramyl pentapeptide phosphotransferase/UDP-N-acetylglucosamine-1-phosphate transferase